MYVPYLLYRSTRPPPLEVVSDLDDDVLFRKHRQKKTDLDLVDDLWKVLVTVSISNAGSAASFQRLRVVVHRILPRSVNLHMHEIGVCRRGGVPTAWVSGKGESLGRGERAEVHQR